MMYLRQRIGHMIITGHPTNLHVWSVTKFFWCYSLPITTMLLGHVSVGVLIIHFIAFHTVCQRKNTGINQHTKNINELKNTYYN